MEQRQTRGGNMQITVFEGVLGSEWPESIRLFSAANINILLAVPRYNLNKEVYHKYTFPIGFCYISSVLKMAGYSVDCLNMNQLYGSDTEILAKALDEKNYNYVCTGGNDIVYSKVEAMLDTIRNHKSKPTSILAGPILTHEPELMCETLRPDIGIVGEGEVTVLELLKVLGENRDISGVNGIIFYDQRGEMIKTPRREPIKNIEILPFPDFESFGFDEHLKHMQCNDYYFHHFHDYPRTYPLLGSRGCAFNCTFCWHPENYRWRSIESIMKEIDYVVKRFKINNLSMVDDCFSIKQDRVYEFCEKIKKLSEEVGWEIGWTCQLLVHTVDRNILKSMKNAGCHSISYGFESMSSVVLRSMMKPITPEQIDRAFRATLESGITVQAHFIFGDTKETLETANQTLDYWINNANGQIGLGFIQPYPGSVMYQRCVEKRIINDKLDYIKNQMDPHNCINMTETISDTDFMNFRTRMLEAYSKNFRFVRPISIKNTGKNIYSVLVICPWCEEKILYKNCYSEKRYMYGFLMSCRTCHMRFFIVGFWQKFGYKYYSKVRTLRNIYKKIRRLHRMEHS